MFTKRLHRRHCQLIVLLLQGRPLTKNILRRTACAVHRRESFRQQHQAGVQFFLRLGGQIHALHQRFEFIACLGLGRQTQPIHNGIQGFGHRGRQ